MQNNNNNIPPYGASSSNTHITTELIQRYLDENKYLILAMVDNQAVGKPNDVARCQARLQQNLMFLASIADAHPQRPTPSHIQSISQMVPVGQMAPMGQMVPVSQMIPVGQTSQSPAYNFQTPQFLAPQPLAALPPMPMPLPIPTVKHEFMPPADAVMNQRIPQSTLEHIQASQLQASQQVFYDQQTSMMPMPQEHGMGVHDMAMRGQIPDTSYRQS